MAVGLAPQFLGKLVGRGGVLKCHHLTGDCKGKPGTGEGRQMTVPPRLVHLAHHRHINDEELDPDHFAGIVDGPLSEALLPVWWLTLFLHYISYCVKRAAEPKGGRWAAVLNDVGVGAPCYLYALWRGFGWSAVVTRGM